MALTRLRTDELANAWSTDRDTPFQIALLGVFDRAPADGLGSPSDVAGVCAELVDHARGVPALARRVLWTRFGEGRPVWVIDPAFDPQAHVQPVTLPAGEQLYAWVANRVVRPLDFDRPLWRVEVIDGLPGARFAVLVVLHHIVADGAAGLAIAASLFDPTPSPTAAAVAGTVARPSPLPTTRALVADRWRQLIGGLRRRDAATPAPRSERRGALAVVRDARADFPGPAPAISLPRLVGPDRRLVVVRRSLDEVRHTGHVLDGTVLDVLLAAVSGGLRELLTARGDSVAGLTLRTIVPAATGDAGQVVGMLVVDLPVGEPDPATRLALVRSSTTAGKRALRAGTGNGTPLLRLPVPLAHLAVRWGRQFGSKRLNLSVTTLRGPTDPLWLDGARLVEAVPVAPLVPLVALNVAALSYAGELAIGVNADSAVTELDVMAEGMDHAFDELDALASR